jgi:trimethylamine---corrinoid protein Co-methyltransferase
VLKEMAMDAVRPTLRLFTDEQVVRVVEDAMRVLQTVGFFVENAEAVELLSSAGLKAEGGRVYAPEAAVRKALSTAPSRIAVYDREGNPALDLGGDAVHFDPGSAAIHFLDPGSRRHRPPVSQDLVHLAWVAQSCGSIAGQSTSLVASDVPESMADRWRLAVALKNCKKPVITGTFRKDAFAVMKAMLAAVRGGEKALKEKPLAIFDCCPTPPMKWSDLTCQALIDGARSGIPAELVSMPMSGASSPVTLREVVVQHCAECLSGILIHQLACPGAPIVYGGSPTGFDMRHGTTPMGAVETMMVDCAYAQVGKSLGLPTHAYMALSDAKSVDYQTGLETGTGAVLAALAGINMVSGPGMLDFESCISLEKLVLDNEACAMALRLAKGIGHGSSGEAVELIRQVVESGSFLGHPHTRKHFREELLIPGRVVDRGTYGDWEKGGFKDAASSAAGEVQSILARGNPAPLPEELSREIDALVAAEAKRLGIGKLPTA